MQTVTNIAPFTPNRDPASRASTSAAKTWKIYLAGTMRMLSPDGENALPNPRKTRALLAYLCLAPHKRVSRNRLATLLWDKTDDLARHSLRQALYALERISGAKAAGLIQFDQDYVSLNEDICWIDVLAEPHDHFERLLDDLDGLSDPFQRWLTDERNRFEDQVRNTLHDAVVQLEAENASAERRCAAARKLVSFDPTHQGGARALMKALSDLGDHVQAIREYHRCREEVRNVYDLPPSQKTVALYEAIRLVSSRHPTIGEKPPKRDATNITGDAPPLKRPSLSSIAVLPISNLTGEARHELTAIGIAEDLTGVLSRLPGFFVTSRLSTRTFADRTDRLPQDIGDLLDVRYLFSGSLRVNGDRLGLSTELTDAIRGTVLWSGYIEDRFSNLMDLSARLAEEIVRQGSPHIRQAELTRVRSKRPEHLNAYDCFLQAQDDMHNFSPAVFDRASRMFDRALQLDPNYAAALAGRAYWHVLRVGQGWSDDPAGDTKFASEFADRALDVDPLEPAALGIQGHISAYLHKDFDLAFERFGDALHLNPNSAPVWVWSAAARAWQGDGRRAVEEAAKGKALSPFDPLNYFFNTIAGMAYLTDAQYERAIECAYLALQENRRYTSGHRLLVLALMLAGHADEGRSAGRRLIAAEPSVTVEKFRLRYPGSGNPRTDLYCKALAEAGVPIR
jgi:DNA-binding SARP family transcriptional activator/TolB-like protein